MPRKCRSEQSDGTTLVRKPRGCVEGQREVQSDRQLRIRSSPGQDKAVPGLAVGAQQGCTPATVGVIPVRPVSLTKTPAVFTPLPSCGIFP